MLSSCHMDGFFSSRPTLRGISNTFPCCRVRFIRVQNTEKGLEKYSKHPPARFFTFLSCSQIHVVFYRSVIHGLGFLIC